MYACLIIDDEPIALRIIQKHLSAFPDFKVIGECHSAIEALPLLKKGGIDLIFCDIKMPQISGIDFIRSLSHPPKVIFTTAYRDYAVEAFELNVVDYLMKPVSFERFTKAIYRFLESESHEKDKKGETSDHVPDFIFLKADKKHYKVNLSDIWCVESMGDYVIVKLQGEKVVTKDRISHFAELLPSSDFIQVHRSYIVAIDKIKAVGPGFVEINDQRIPVGRNYKQALVKLMTKS